MKVNQCNKSYLKCIKKASVFSIDIYMLQNNIVANVSEV